MDLKEQIIQEYLQQGCGYRKLQAKYGISRTTICKWVQVYQGIHGLDRTHKQQSHYLRDMDDPHKKSCLKSKSRQMTCRKKLQHLKSNCNGKNSGPMHWIQ